jgi:NTE family protein
VAVVIGSGGVKCAAAMGMWKVLARERIPVDVVVGCSGGAIYAAAMALGFDVTEAERQTLVGWRDLFGRLHRRSVLRAVFPRLLRFSERVGLLDDRRVDATLRAVYGARTFADCGIPLFLVATDYATGEKVTLDAGPVADAVRASIALPLLLRAVPRDGRLLADGGLSNPLPVDVAIRERCDVILAMGFESVLPRVGSLVGAVGRISSIVTNHLLRATYAFHSLAHHAEVIPLMPQIDARIGLTDADAVPALIAAGERATEAQLPYLHRILAAGAGIR